MGRASGAFEGAGVGGQLARGGAGAPSAFVGRRRELGVLRVALERASAGDPRVVLVEGEAGIGKSSLLGRFVGELGLVTVLRASGDEREMLLPFGVVEQLLANAGIGSGPSVGVGGVGARGGGAGAVDPLLVGAELVRVLSELQERTSAVVVVVVDDLQWSDLESALALLFAVRRLRADRVLGLLSTRVGELGRLGEGWARFLAGGEPVVRLRAEGLGGEDLVALGRALGVGELPPAAVSSLLAHTAGNPLYCRALLEELTVAELARARDGLPAPRALASVILTRLGALSEPARDLVLAASVLGRRASLVDAASLAGEPDPLVALEEAVAAGLVVERDGVAGSELVFVHPLIHRAVYDDLPAARRRKLHGRAARLVSGDEALDHRVAATTGVDAALADDLGSSARRSGLLGHLQLLRGGGALAESLLLEAWEAHDPLTEPLVGVAAAIQLSRYYAVASRFEESVAFADLAGAAAGGAHEVLATVGPISLTLLGRGREAHERLAVLPDTPAEVSIEASDALVARGGVKMYTGDLRGAWRDLHEAAKRQHAGVRLQHQSEAVAWLGETEYRLGRWDDAVVHSELAVSLARDADRGWDFPFVHAGAALVPARRGEWEVAQAHVRAAVLGGEQSGLGAAIAVSNTAAAVLATSRNDPAGVLEATATIRETGRADVLGRPGIYDWRELEVDALIALGRVGDAQAALPELETATPDDLIFSVNVAVARLRGALAACVEDAVSAERAFAGAWELAEALDQPFDFSLLGLADGTRLRRAGERRRAVARLQLAREQFASLRAAPYVGSCDRQLERCGVHTGAGDTPASHGLTPAELAVARLVATGKTNRQAAEELYVTIKTIEFHLRGVFAKLGISTRREIAGRLEPLPAQRQERLD